MLYIITALKPEAQAFVDKYKLKKEKFETFTIFVNEDIRLIVSGLGVQNSKKAVNEILKNFSINQTDVFLNVGICGADKKYGIGELLQIGLVIYKDKKVILNKGIKNTLTCKDNEASETKYEIVDMESFGFYEALKKRLHVNNIYIYKVVSDHFEPYKVTKEKTKALIFNKIDNIIKEIKNENSSGNRC